MLIASGEGRENRGLWWLGRGVFGGQQEETSGDLERSQVPEQSGVFGRQEEKTAGGLGEFKTQEENSVKGTQAYGTEGCGRACRNGANRASKDAREQNSRKNNSQRRDRPKEQKSNAREGSGLKADKTHQGEGPNPQKDQSRASKEKARPRPREKEDRRPSAAGRPLPITQGLKPTEGSDEERFKSPATNFVPHLAIELAPPPIEEGRPILDIGKHQMKVEGSTRPAVTSPADRQPVPQQTWRTTTSRPNHPSRQTNHELNNSSGLQISKQSHSPQQQSRNRGEPKNAQRPQPTNQFEPSPSTQRPYVRCPSAMLCIPKVCFIHSLLQPNLLFRKTVTLSVSLLRTRLPTHHS